MGRVAQGHVHEDGPIGHATPFHSGEHHSKPGESRLIEINT
jgi:hypothetical protein